MLNQFLVLHFSLFLCLLMLANYVTKWFKEAKPPEGSSRSHTLRRTKALQCGVCSTVFALKRELGFVRT